MDKKLKNNLLLVGFGVALFVALMNLNVLKNGLVYMIDLFFPVILGFMLAFVLNVPMRGIETRINKLILKMKKKPKPKPVRLISLVLTAVFIILVIVLVCYLVIPALVSSVVSLYELILDKWPGWAETLRQYNIDTTKITEWFAGLDLSVLVGKLTSGAGSIVSFTVSTVSAVVGGITDFGFGLVISIYLLLCKDELGRQVKKLLAAHTKKTFADYVLHVSGMVNKTYTSFLSGQCVEACILGILMVIVMAAFRIPYAGLIAVLTAVSAFIPYVGAFLSCALGAFLVLLVDPSKFLLCIILYQAVQFIENQFIYPHVVGSSVGLSPLWTLVAVLIGGKLMGLFGMIFFIPLAAVLYELVKENTNRKLAKSDAIADGSES